MERKLGKLPSQIRKHAQILNQDRVQPRLIIWLQICVKPGKLLFLHKRIDRHIDPAAVKMDEIDGPDHRFLLQILRIRSGSEPASANIDRVGSRVDSRPHTLIGAGRR